MRAVQEGQESVAAQQRRKEKERDNEVPMLVSLASIWMICHPPGAIRYLEQLAELKSALRNEKKSIFLVDVDTFPSFNFFKSKLKQFFFAAFLP